MIGLGAWHLSTCRRSARIPTSGLGVTLESPHTLRVSLIVCTVGRVDTLNRLLSSLEASTTVPAEVIIVDQNSDRRVKRVVTQYETRGLPILHLRSERGLSRARNVGLKAATSEIIGFPDDDCWYPPELLSKVCAYFAENGDVDILSMPTVDGNQKPSLSPCLESEAEIGRGNVWYCGNSNGIFVRSTVIRAPLLFDEQIGVGSGTPFGSGEETDFMLSALTHGFKGKFSPIVAVGHEQVLPDVDGPIGSRPWSYAHGHAAVLVKHKYPPWVLFFAVVRSAISAIRYALLLDLRRCGYKVKWTAGLVSGAARYSIGLLLSDGVGAKASKDICARRREARRIEARNTGGSDRT